MKTSKVLQNDYILDQQLTKIIDKNCTDIPYEGTDINKEAIIDDIIKLLTSSKEYSLVRHTKQTNFKM